MKTIIIYSSKYGCTADCAKELKSGLSGTVELVDIDQTNPKAILLESFDVVIFGSSIYIGAVSKKMRADRLIMKATTKGNDNNLKIVRENIESFIGEIS